MDDEAEQWRLMHILQGHIKPAHCKNLCSDPQCEVRCLQQEASLHFRADIMHGVEILRKESDPRFPLMIPQYAISSCTDGYLCKDSVCQVVGCMKIPGYNFRELIKIAYDNKIIKALKR